MKNIIIRSLQKNDLMSAKMFAEYMNALVKDEEPIILNKKITIGQEKHYLEERLQNIKKYREVYLIAMEGNFLVGIAHIALRDQRQNHVGEVGISVRKKYRGQGLGNGLMKQAIIEIKKLKPIPYILRLSVMASNDNAIKLYEKFGFKKIATIPEQIKTGKSLVDEIIMLLRL